jgi:hypothetical protein
MVETKKKPLKKYEKVNLLKNSLKQAEVQFEFYESRVPKMKKNLENLKEYHKSIEMVSVREIESMEKTKADWYEEIERRKKALRTFDVKPKPKPKPKVENGNGKVKCDLCGKEFSKQGFPAHYKKCKRIKELELELAKELEEPEEPQLEIEIKEED